VLPLEQRGVAPSPEELAAELAAIWRDPKLLRAWTYGWLEAAGDNQCWEGEARVHEENTRRWLLQLRDTDPKRFVQLYQRYHRQLWWDKALRPRKRGRPRGRHQLGFSDAWELHECIQYQWKRVFGHWYRKDVALQIAASVFSTRKRRITVQQLRDYNNTKNRSRS
jgi:hypothetical protein